MRDNERNTNNRNGGNVRKKRRRRKQNLSLYYTAIFFLVAVVGIILSLTVFFNVKEVTVTGNSIYTNNDIILASGIKTGDNLVRLGSSKVEKKIVSSLPYVDTATVTKKFPDKVEIEVTPSVEFANIKYESGYLLISGSGKILSYSAAPKSGYPVIIGCENENFDPGKPVTIADEENEKAFYSLIETMIAEDVTEKITEIDISDRYNISIVYDDRIRVELGSLNDLSYKLRFSYMLVNEKISINKKGTLYMKGNNSNEASFVEDIPETIPPETTPTDETADSGEETDVSEETSVPEETTLPEETTPETTTEATEPLPPVGIVPSV